MNQNILNLALSSNNIIIYLQIQINLQKYPHALYQLRKWYWNNFKQWLLIKLFVLGNASVAKFNTLHFVALIRYFLWFQEISQLEAEWYRWSTQGSWDESIVIQLTVSWWDQPQITHWLIAEEPTDLLENMNQADQFCQQICHQDVWFTLIFSCINVVMTHSGAVRTWSLIRGLG